MDFNQNNFEFKCLKLFDFRLKLCKLNKLDSFKRNTCEIEQLIILLNNIRSKLNNVQFKIKRSHAHF